MTLPLPEKGEEFIIDLSGRKIPIEQLRLDNLDRFYLLKLVECFGSVLRLKKTFHNETLNLFTNSLVKMLANLIDTGKMESSMSNGRLTIKVGVVKVEELKRSIGQHRAFLCTDKSVRIDAHDKGLIEQMMNCMIGIIAKKEEEEWFIPKFHHRTLKNFFIRLYKIFFETDKLRHFNNCVDKEGNMYISTFYK